MARKGQAFSTQRKQRKVSKFPTGKKPIKRGQALAKQCPLCGYGKDYRDLCSNAGCAGSRPKPTSNPRASEMVERPSGLWVPPWHEGGR